MTLKVGEGKHDTHGNYLAFYDHIINQNSHFQSF